MKDLQPLVASWVQRCGWDIQQLGDKHEIVHDDITKGSTMIRKLCMAYHNCYKESTVFVLVTMIEVPTVSFPFYCDMFPLFPTERTDRPGQ